MIYFQFALFVIAAAAVSLSEVSVSIDRFIEINNIYNVVEAETKKSQGGWGWRWGGVRIFWLLRDLLNMT